MSRIRLVLASAAVALGVVGCAQCDTCDDFPAACVGPNCGQNSAGGMPGLLAPTMSQGPAVMGAATPTAPVTYDAAGPAPTAPEPAPTPAAPPVDPTTPPAPMESAPR